jgi:hypothetical protein
MAGGRQVVSGGCQFVVRCYSSCTHHASSVRQKRLQMVFWCFAGGCQLTIKLLSVGFQVIVRWFPEVVR